MFVHVHVSLNLVKLQGAVLRGLYKFFLHWPCIQWTLSQICQHQMTEHTEVATAKLRLCLKLFRRFEAHTQSSLTARTVRLGLCQCIQILYLLMCCIVTVCAKVCAKSFKAHSSLVDWSQVSGSWGTHWSSVSSQRSHQRVQWGHPHTGSCKAHTQGQNKYLLCAVRIIEMIFLFRMSRFF